jgi:type III secretory pathway component EscV
MKTQSKWLLVGGLIVAAVIALKLGVPMGTLLIVGALLLCCGPMLFMRGNKNHVSGSKGTNGRSNETTSKSLPEQQERKATQTKQ